MSDGIVYIDVEEGCKRVMGNIKLYVKLLEKFKLDTNISDLSQTLFAKDYESAKGQAHAIKGLSANLSLTELYKQVFELEKQIKAQQVDMAQYELVKQVSAATIEEINKVISANA